MQMDYLQLTVTGVGFLLSLGVNIVAVAFAFGLLHGRVSALEKNLAKADESDTEIFSRLRGLENVTPRLESATERLEKVLNNGITQKIVDLTTRVHLMEQHCADVQAARAADMSTRNHVLT